MCERPRQTPSLTRSTVLSMYADSNSFPGFGNQSADYNPNSQYPYYNDKDNWMPNFDWNFDDFVKKFMNPADSNGASMYDDQRPENPYSPHHNPGMNHQDIYQALPEYCKKQAAQAGQHHGYPHPSNSSSSLDTYDPTREDKPYPGLMNWPSFR